MFEEGKIINELLIERLNYFIYVVLLLIGLHAMISKRNLIKKLIGMSIFQTSIILFYVSISAKHEATIPIYKAEHDPHGEHTQAVSTEIDVDNLETTLRGPTALSPEETSQYANPLPHVLMLTAIVVGVATLGLALALCLRIYQGYGTIEEDQLLTKLEVVDARSSLSPLARLRASRRRSSRKPRRKKPAAKTQTGSPQASAEKKAPPAAKKTSSPKGQGDRRKTGTKPKAGPKTRGSAKPGKAKKS